MGGTVNGGKQAADTNIERYGPDFYKNLGKKGGSWKSPTKGFGSDHNRASLAGKKGGLAKRKKSALKTECRRGHPYTPENTYIYPRTNTRYCRICQITKSKESYRRKRALQSA